MLTHTLAETLTLTLTHTLTLGFFIICFYISFISNFSYFLTFDPYSIFKLEKILTASSFLIFSCLLSGLQAYQVTVKSQ